jgi:hypothetical protein
VAGADEAGDVAVGGVVGDAGHRHPQPLAHLPAGQDDVEDAGGDPGVVVEGFVEVAEAEEEDGVGEAALDLEVLAAERDDPAVVGPGEVGDRRSWFRFRFRDRQPILRRRRDHGLLAAAGGPPTGAGLGAADRGVGVGAG